MLKKIVMLALAVMAVAVVTALTASANWTHSGKVIPVGTNPQGQATGQASFTNAVVGGINCQNYSNVEFTGGGTTGFVKSLEIDTTEGGTVTQKCVTSGPIASCRVKSVQPTGLPWVIHSDGADVISITSGEVHYVLESQTGATCSVAQQVTLKSGTVNINVPAGKTSAVEQVQLSGELETSTGAKGSVSGTQTMNPSGTFGTA